MSWPQKPQTITILGRYTNQGALVSLNDRSMAEVELEWRLLPKADIPSWENFWDVSHIFLANFVLHFLCAKYSNK